MKVLVLNSGSSSLKYQVFEMPAKTEIAKGLAEKIGDPASFLVYKKDGKKITIEKSFPTHKEALQEIFFQLTKGEMSAVEDLKEIDAVGHRVVHGGEAFSESVLISDHVKKEIEDCNDLAPLHNPANLLGITACEELMGKDTPQVAVFDTAFHQTMKEENYLYPIPYEYYEKYKIRKYGFHGTSHKYVAHRACEILEKDIQEQKIITCHLGNGASLAAIKDGEVVDTSMGFTPLAGIMMGTRSGDIDSSILPFLCKKENISVDDAVNILNKKSGLLGISQQSSDMRDIEYGDAQCQLALDIYINRIVKYIGSYVAILGGVDALVFTAGVGERGPLIREKVIEKLYYLGIHLDVEKNDIKAEEVIISTPESAFTALVVPTEEEMMIAQDTYTIVENLGL